VGFRRNLCELSEEKLVIPMLESFLRYEKIPIAPSERKSPVVLGDSYITLGERASPPSGTGSQCLCREGYGFKAPIFFKRRKSGIENTMFTVRSRHTTATGLPTKRHVSQFRLRDLLFHRRGCPSRCIL